MAGRKREEMITHESVMLLIKCNALLRPRWAFGYFDSVSVCPSVSVCQPEWTETNIKLSAWLVGDYRFWGRKGQVPPQYEILLPGNWSLCFSLHKTFLINRCGKGTNECMRKSPECRKLSFWHFSAGRCVPPPNTEMKPMPLVTREEDWSGLVQWHSAGTGAVTEQRK